MYGKVTFLTKLTAQLAGLSYNAGRVEQKIDIH